jgi:hypothetical protein
MEKGIGKMIDSRIEKLSKLLYKYQGEEANTIDAILIWFKEDVVPTFGLAKDDMDSMKETIESWRI